jgi:hypothetical protein
MQLFDEIERTDVGPATHTEDSYTYYNRSGRVGIVRIRELLQSWFDRYPETEEEELAARFRADFDSAFFELFLHELLLRLGIEVIPHPTLDNEVATRPDFGLRGESSAAYLEARVARDESDERRRKRKVLGIIYDQINSLSIPDYFLRIVDVELISGNQPSMSRLGQELVAWIDTLDYGALRRRQPDLESLDELPTWTFADDAVRVEISACPVSESRRGASDHRPIGIYPFESRWGGSDASLRRALERKGTKFGSLNSPFIIAVNSLSSWGFDRIDHMQALFGTEQILVERGGPEPQMVRAPNGFWYGPNGPQHTRVSGALFCQVGPWNVHSASLCLYHNPWAQFAYEGELTQLPQAIPRNGQTTWSDGIDLGDLFGLSPEWLGE